MTKQIQTEIDRLREEVQRLEGEKRRIFAAFCCADSTLRICYDEDLRSEADQKEAEVLRAYMAGDTVMP